MRSSAGWEFFEHTADVGIRAWGPDFAAVLTETARGLMHLLTGGSFTATEQASFTVKVTTHDTQELVVGWLQELLLKFELEHLVADVCVFDELTSQRLRATVHAQRCDPSTERLGREVKAITYHGLKVEMTNGCRIEVIVDV